jgi:hypothetical protein
MLRKKKKKEPVKAIINSLPNTDKKTKKQQKAMPSLRRFRCETIKSSRKPNARILRRK